MCVFSINASPIDRFFRSAQSRARRIAILEHAQAGPPFKIVDFPATLDILPLPIAKRPMARLARLARRANRQGRPTASAPMASAPAAMPGTRQSRQGAPSNRPCAPGPLQDFFP